MKNRTLPFALFLLLALVLFAPVPAHADGIVIVEPPICDPAPCPPLPGVPPSPLAVRYHHVNVTIQDQVAVTHVDQVFFNPSDQTIEGVYIFPLPLDATVTEFTLWVDGQPIEGEVLAADEARGIYENIVRTMRDPALLEYVGQGAFKASIFPIAPGGERRIELEYTQALTVDNGLVRYVYPLNTEKFSALPLESVSINVEIQGSQSIRAVYSPTHPVAVSHLSDSHVVAGYEDSNVKPDSDFALYYSIGETEAFHLLSFRDPGDPDDPDGFFLLMLAPRPDASSAALSKDVILVLDKSGSMEGEKFRQAQEALRFILNNLNPEDRFNVITFSTGLETYASRLRPATEANEAIGWVGRLTAFGSTDINRALLEAAAMADRERPTYLIFLTDGLPTEGVIDSQSILDNLAGAAPGNLRLFAFGVGYDVDTFLLDSLAQAHHGTSTYVRPGERLDENLSAFYEKISTPVLTNLELDFGGLSVFDLYPYPLPDLFSGSQIVVVGRYRGGGATNVTLTGEVDGKVQTFRFSEQVFTSDSRASDEGVLSTLPRLWATRKIGYLLNQVRLHGPDQETVDQIVRLSIRYGIVTPYTSYLVTEDMPLGEAEQDRIAAQQFSALQATQTAPTFGEEAVEKAADQGALAAAEVPEAAPEEAGDLIRTVGSHAFILSDGVWIDTAFDPDNMDTVKVAFLSDDYFALVAARPELADAFALGDRVIALSDGIAYEVVSEGESVDPIDVPPPVQPSNGGSSGGSGIVINPPRTAPRNPEASPLSDFFSNLPCLGGLLPLAFLPLALVATLKKKSH